MLLCALCLGLAGVVFATDFFITDISITGQQVVVVEHESQEDAYYLLLRGPTPTTITGATDMALGQIDLGTLADTSPANGTVFYLVKQLSIGTPGDWDGDGASDVFELRNPNFRNPLDGADIDVIPPPWIDPLPYTTDQNSVTVSGSAFPGAEILVTGGTEEVNGVVDPTGFFSLELLLRENRRNRIFATVSLPGSPGVQQPFDVIHDVEPPFLFIDFPEDGMVLSEQSPIVAGRVGDRLSGFMGLDVQVNGSGATVNVGVGQNGTFEYSGLALREGLNAIAAVAADVHGHSITQEISVVYQKPTGTLLRLDSGDDQLGSVNQRLPAPIVVEVVKADGSPFAGKVVTFEVVRSDGRLKATSSGPDGGTMSASVLTDAAGLASVYWTLGSDAGCGNNRLRVRSKDVAGFVYFCASAQPAPPSQINIGEQYCRQAQAGATVPGVLQVWVSDSCNGVPNLPVTFTVLKGGGTVNGASSATVDTSITGHADVTLTLGPSAGNQVVEADFPGNTGEPATFTIFGVKSAPGQTTQLKGVILDNAGQPIGGARCELMVGGSLVPEVISDAEGQFVFDGIPAGPAHLHVDGATANLVNGNPILTNTFPSLPFELIVVPNAANIMPTPVLLPALDANNEVVYDSTEDVVLTVEGIEGLELFIQAGSMLRADGSFPNPFDPEVLSLNQVHVNDVPMPMPNGSAPPFAWTLQPAGATFDPPIEIRYPNMSGLPPGAIAYFLTFDHDLENFQIVASAQVSADGSQIVSDPGVGLTKAGWGGQSGPTTATTTGIGGCGGACVRGSISDGAISVDAPDCPRVGDTVTFSISGAEDSGGERTSSCSGKTTTYDPVPVEYFWVVALRGSAGGTVANGSGNLGSFEIMSEGTYDIRVTALARRECSPSSKEISTTITAGCPRINLNLVGGEDGVVTLLDDYGLNARPDTECSLATYNFEIRRTGKTEWCPVQDGPNSVAVSVARLVGDVQARVILSLGGEPCDTNTVDFQIQFPSDQEIFRDESVLNLLGSAWAKTLELATSNTVQEVGFWLAVNTATGTYMAAPSEFIVGAAYTVNQSGVALQPGDFAPFNPDPQALLTPCEEPIYAVAWVHTHPPHTFRPGSREVGASDGDEVNSGFFQMPGLIIDYLGVGGRISNGHDPNGPIDVFSLPPRRRPPP